ncbi:DoxX family protein [Terrabacter sp. LjRoot27]|uniref:DoxX family protein n=1 Tax=Terrabacter sp. LjRoot27 TaxID=3342306 RepID=UPI003ECF2182
MKTATNAPLGKDAIALAGLFLTSGTMHFVKPEPFEAMVPQQLPSRRALVYASGALEIACAVGLFIPRTRRVAGLASAALLVAVFPANVTMTGQAKRRLDRKPDDAKRQGYLAATVARLPLQWPMIRTALRAGGVVR